VPTDSVRLELERRLRETLGRLCKGKSQSPARDSHNSHNHHPYNPAAITTSEEYEVKTDTEGTKVHNRGQHNKNKVKGYNE
jgi:hypothetical protein